MLLNELLNVYGFDFDFHFVQGFYFELLLGQFCFLWFLIFQDDLLRNLHRLCLVVQLGQRRKCFLVWARNLKLSAGRPLFSLVGLLKPLFKFYVVAFNELIEAVLSFLGLIYCQITSFLNLYVFLPTFHTQLIVCFNFVVTSELWKLMLNLFCQNGLRLVDAASTVTRCFKGISGLRRLLFSFLHHIFFVPYEHFCILFSMFFTFSILLSFKAGIIIGNIDDFNLGISVFCLVNLSGVWLYLT